MRWALSTSWRADSQSLSMARARKLHKLRRAMVRPGRDRLQGVVEVDEIFMGGPRPGKRGAQARCWSKRRSAGCQLTGNSFATGLLDGARPRIAPKAQGRGRPAAARGRQQAAQGEAPVSGAVSRDRAAERNALQDESERRRQLRISSTAPTRASRAAAEATAANAALRASVKAAATTPPPRSSQASQVTQTRARARGQTGRRRAGTECPRFFAP